MSAETMTMASILQGVADRHGHPSSFIRYGSGRSNDVMLRHEAMYLMYATKRWSQPQIGAFFGGIDHTSVRNGIIMHGRRNGLPPLCGARKPSKNPRPRTKPEALESRLIEIKGTMDGIRWGLLKIEGSPRSFFHDRLNGVVRIYSVSKLSSRQSVDKNPARNSLAKAILEAAWAVEKAQ